MVKNILEYSYSGKPYKILYSSSKNAITVYTDREKCPRPWTIAERNKGCCQENYFFKKCFFLMISNIHNVELCEDQNTGKSYNQSEWEKTG